jgi:thymidylate synthase (FAD)
MQVRLEWITPGAEALVAHMARVSNPENQDNAATAPRLLRYLIEHAHWSPFEMVNMCVRIETTRAVSAQLLRHRSFTFQEYSQRYAVAPKAAPPALRRQDAKNRQSSHDDLSDALVAKHTQRIGALLDAVHAEYEAMISDGIAKECARAVLPMCSPTTLYMNGTLRSWLHYCDLRCAPSTQLEHREVADAIKLLLCAHVPAIAAAMWPE